MSAIVSVSETQARWYLDNMPVPVPSKPPPCACWRCATSRALTALGAAHETALEETLELEMREAFLRDEVAAALAGPLSKVKGRLRAALEVAR